MTQEIWPGCQDISEFNNAILLSCQTWLQLEQAVPCSEVLHFKKNKGSTPTHCYCLEKQQKGNNVASIKVSECSGLVCTAKLKRFMIQFQQFKETGLIQKTCHIIWQWNESLPTLAKEWDTGHNAQFVGVSMVNFTKRLKGVLECHAILGGYISQYMTYLITQHVLPESCLPHHPPYSQPGGTHRSQADNALAQPVTVSLGDTPSGGVINFPVTINYWTLKRSLEPWKKLGVVVRLLITFFGWKKSHRNV